MAALLLTAGSFAASVKTDRTWYLAGEPMQVSVGTEGALIAYAELCDQTSLAAGVVISLDQGRGIGTIELPADMHSGYYMLSVYTRDNALVTRRLIAIVNPLHRSQDDDITWLAIADGDSLSYPSMPRGERLSYDEMSVEKPVDIRETEGHIIRARIANVYRGTTYHSHQINPSLSIVGKQVHYFEGRMVNDTTALFFTHGLHGKQPLVLSAATYDGQSIPIEMISPFEVLLPKQLPHLIFHYRRSEVEQRSLAMQRHQLAIAPEKRELQLGDYADDTAEDGVPLDYDDTIYGTRPDLSYNLDEYRQFFTVKDVITEYVHLVHRVRINGLPQLVVRSNDAPYDSKWPAMVFIDGMPVIDIERLLNYDARRIHYINIYAHQYVFGNYVYNGILSFITRSGRLTNYKTEPNVQYLVYDFPE